MKEQNIIQNSDLKNAVFKKIDCGEVSMRPKSYFYFKIALTIFVIFVTLIISALLLSYMLFSLREGGHIYLLGFGIKGFYEFFMLFPWVILVIDIALLMFLDWLLKGFRFGYNSPIIYLFLGTFVFITLFSSLINYTSFHRSIMYRAEDRRLPIASGFYDGLRQSHSKYGIFRGVVSSIEGNTFTIMHYDYDYPSNGTLVKVIAPNGVKVANLLKVGDQVFVGGEATTSSQIKAYGVNKLPNKY